MSEKTKLNLRGIANPQSRFSEGKNIIGQKKTQSSLGKMEASSLRKEYRLNENREVLISDGKNGSQVLIASPGESGVTILHRILISLQTTSRA